MSVIYPTVADIRAIHRKELDAAGGTEGIRDHEALESAAKRPKQAFDGQDLYPDIIDKAAALFESLVQNHPFVDGNKRTGVRTTFAFVECNGLEVTASQSEVVEFTLSVASGERSLESIAEWFDEHTE